MQEWYTAHGFALKAAERANAAIIDILQSCGTEDEVEEMALVVTEEVL